MGWDLILEYTLRAFITGEKSFGEGFEDLVVHIYIIQGEAAVIHKEVGSGLVLTLIWVDGPCAYIVRSITCGGSKSPVRIYCST